MSVDSSSLDPGQFVPGPGVILWAGGREGLAEPVDPEALAGFHPGWAQDASAFAPWQEISRPWPDGCGAEQWWISPESACRVRSSVVVCGPCSSVLDVARPLAECGAFAPWDSVLGVRQWSGRGQLRRDWQSPPGNMYACVLLPPCPGELDSLVPLLVGHCLAGFFGAYGHDMRLKWPNDLIENNTKIGGVLVEERKGHVLAGIGINLCSAPLAGTLRQGHAVPAGRLARGKAPCSPLGLWVELVNYLKNCYQKCLQLNTAPLLASVIEKNLAWRGERVEVREGVDPSRRGRLLGLGPDGALRLLLEDGSGEELRLVSGSIWPVKPG